MNQHLSNALNTIDQKYGKESVKKIEDPSTDIIDFIRTGSFGIDLISGLGGVPKRHITEIFGKPDSGKSTLALHLIQNAQGGGQCAYIDAEHALDPDYAKKIGVDIERLLISKPNSGEEALDIAEALLGLPNINLIIIDSVAALAPKAELCGKETDFLEHSKMLQQRLMNLSKVVSTSNAAVVFINQLRDSRGKFGRCQKTSGGPALRFYAWLRIGLAKLEAIKKEDSLVGNHIFAKIVKNKLWKQNIKTSFDVLYNTGISKESDLINIGMEFGIITLDGSWYHLKDYPQPLGHGRWEAIETLKKDPSLVQTLAVEIQIHFWKKH